MSVLSALHDQVRSLLKSISEEKPEKGGKAAVPKDPGDPDELQPDYRVDGAQPSKKDMEGAKGNGDEVEEEEEDGGAPPEDTEGEEVDEEGEEPTDGEKAGAEEGRPVATGFDEFGNADISPEETRELLKSLKYGETPPIPEEKLLDGGEDLKAMLDDILTLLAHATQKLEANSAIMSDLMSEIDRLKKGAARQERQITKALEALGNPITAPAAAPRGIAKSYANPQTPPSEAPVADKGALANDIFFAMRAGKMTHAEAISKCREARLGA